MATSKQTHTITTDETRNVLVDMSQAMAEAELLTGTPIIQHLPALTISNTQINSSKLIINGKRVPVGKAVSFRVSSVTAGEYQIDIVCNTNGGQIVEGTIKLTVVTTVF